MLNVFIVEDTPELATTYEAHINKQIFINDYNAAVTLVCNNSAPVLEQLKAQQIQGGLYFLDIEIADKVTNGIDLAMAIRNLDIDAAIVFLTSHDEMVMPAIEAKVTMLDYIIKTSGLEKSKQRITEDLALAIKRNIQINKQRTGFVYSIGTKKFTAQPDDVLYLESAASDHKLILHQVNEINDLNGNLNVFEKDYDFLVRIYRSILVNVNKIVTVDTKARTVTLTNGIELPISTHYMKELIKNRM
ncbi:response regulator transcription factor [Periweissella cryptocerci]|uniref:Response regulator transcription factor n=1 Tax=Periweissella cryptocerci TaxID=2506420 RepID=A0A4P6YRC9_9LACO|nr:LytTR family DNA-binding domain-containing protein [Periweissella cryptocerci]QBO35153.1 response regulator transcription factor [Periweissella cryptocerci]